MATARKFEFLFRFYGTILCAVCVRRLTFIVVWHHNHASALCRIIPIMAAMISDFIVMTVAYVNTKWRICHVVVTWTLRFCYCRRNVRRQYKSGSENNKSVLTCDVKWNFLATIVPADVTSIYGTASYDARLRCIRFRGPNQHPVTENTHNLRLVIVVARNNERSATTDQPNSKLSINRGPLLITINLAYKTQSFNMQHYFMKKCCSLEVVWVICNRIHIIAPTQIVIT